MLACVPKTAVHSVCLFPLATQISTVLTHVFTPPRVLSGLASIDPHEVLSGSTFSLLIWHQRLYLLVFNIPPLRPYLSTSSDVFVTCGSCYRSFPCLPSLSGRSLLPVVMNLLFVPPRLAPLTSVPPEVLTFCRSLIPPCVQICPIPQSSDLVRFFPYPNFPILPHPPIPPLVVFAP